MESIPDLKAKQQVFIDLAMGNIRRLGLVPLLEYLEKNTNFLTAPSSTNHHLNVIGGLVQHSINVYEVLLGVNNILGAGLNPESMAIAALFHDACKGLSYKVDWKWVKPDHKWEKQELWVPDNEQFPAGHGEKSVMMILPHMNLTEEEILAIRWHMGFSEPGTVFGYPTGYALGAAMKKYPLVAALHAADLLSASVLEKEA